MYRRDFLKAGAALGAAAVRGVPRAAALAQPQRFKIGLAATLWLTAKPTTEEYWVACKEIASLGIRATEADNSEAKLDTAYGDKLADFKSQSAPYRMTLTGVYHPLLLHESGKLGEMRQKTSHLAKFLKAVGAEYIALGWDVPPPVGGRVYQRTPSDVKNAIQVMNELGRMCRQENGITVAYHAERDQPKEIILRALDETDPTDVRFCADVGHLTASGLDAVQTVKTYASRLAVSHWKDFDPKLPAPEFYGSDAKGDFTELGRGIVDFTSLAGLYKELDFAGWVMIELDRAGQKSGFLESAREMKGFVTDKLKLRVVGVA
jgi:sugar phosphate isomerase/epimerase